MDMVGPVASNGSWHDAILASASLRRLIWRVTSAESRCAKRAEAGSLCYDSGPHLPRDRGRYANVKRHDPRVSMSRLRVRTANVLPGRVRLSEGYRATVQLCDEDSLPELWTGTKASQHAGDLPFINWENGIHGAVRAIIKWFFASCAGAPNFY